jgi:ribosomal protein S12 methylthiotransferase accessory factor
MVSGHPLSMNVLGEPPQLDTAEVLTRAARVVSERTGLISFAEVVETSPCDPSAFWVRTVPADTEPIFDVRAYSEGNASARDADGALLKAVGESIERYCAASANCGELTLASFRSMELLSVPPSSWALFSDQQYRARDFPVPRFTEDTTIRWAPAYSLTRDLVVQVPASFVYIPYTPGPGETRIIPWQVSTGLACHTSLTRAALKSLLEVVERDAFMLFWHRRIRCPEVDVSAIADERLRSLLDLTEVPGYQRHILLLTADLPLPIVLVAMTSMEHKPYVVMGCAADCQPENALRLALEEALLSMHGITNIAESEPEYAPAEKGYLDVRDLMRHAWIYAVDPRLREVTSAQFVPSGVVAWADLPRAPTDSALGQLRWIVTQLEARGYEAIVADLTTIDVDDVGFKVMRGMVPGMQPLDVDHRFMHLGGPRLYLTPEKLGVPAHRFSGATLNPYPHPFP